jgi:hypothetical protein
VLQGPQELLPWAPQVPKQLALKALPEPRLQVLQARP